MPPKRVILDRREGNPLFLLPYAMKIKILIDNISGCANSGNTCESCTAKASQKQLKGEWGLCVYTEFNGKRILLDTGASAQFAKNAAILGIDISQIDAGILSHGHYDHANGMQEFFKHNNHAKFYLRDSAAENCYHTHKFLKFFTATRHRTSTKSANAPTCASKKTASTASTVSTTNKV